MFRFSLVRHVLLSLLVSGLLVCYFVSLLSIASSCQVLWLYGRFTSLSAGFCLVSCPTLLRHTVCSFAAMCAVALPALCLWCASGFARRLSAPMTLRYYVRGVFCSPASLPVAPSNLCAASVWLPFSMNTSWSLLAGSRCTTRRCAALVLHASFGPRTALATTFCSCQKSSRSRSELKMPHPLLSENFAELLRSIWLEVTLLHHAIHSCWDPVVIAVYRLL